MINHKNIKEIINITLKNMGVFSPELELLILGTFSVESQLKTLYTNSNNMAFKYGLMMMNDEKLDYVLNVFLKYRSTISKSIHAACGVNVVTATHDQILWQAKTNISFMVALTYCWYAGKIDEVPDINLVSLSKCYEKYYDCGVGNHTKEEFVNGLKATL